MTSDVEIDGETPSSSSARPASIRRPRCMVSATCSGIGAPNRWLSLRATAHSGPIMGIGSRRPRRIACHAVTALHIDQQMKGFELAFNDSANRHAVSSRRLPLVDTGG